MAAIEIHGTSPATTEALQKAILSILSAKHADESTKKIALKVLESGVKQGNSTISYCTFEGKF